MDLLASLLKLTFLALAISTVAIMITKSLMFENFRKKADHFEPRIGYAFKCTFCTIGWLSLFFTMIEKPPLLSRLFPTDSITILVINCFVMWFALWGFATLFYRHIWGFLEKNAPKMRIKLKK